MLNGPFQQVGGLFLHLAPTGAMIRPRTTTPLGLGGTILLPAAYLAISAFRTAPSLLTTTIIPDFAVSLASTLAPLASPLAPLASTLAPLASTLAPLAPTLCRLPRLGWSLGSSRPGRASLPRLPGRVGLTLRSSGSATLRSCARRAALGSRLSASSFTSTATTAAASTVAATIATGLRGIAAICGGRAVGSHGCSIHLDTKKAALLVPPTKGPPAMTGRRVPIC